MAHQLSIDFDSAVSRGRLGMERTAARTERKHSGWVATAVEKLRAFADATTEIFTIEEARASIEAQLPKPADLRAWGQVTQSARRLGVIVPAGVKPAASSNGSLKPAYRRAGH